MAMMTMMNATTITITIKMTTTITIKTDGGWNRMTTMMTQIKIITATTNTNIIIVNNNNAIDSIYLLQLITHAMAL